MHKVINLCIQVKFYHTQNCWDLKFYILNFLWRYFERYWWQFCHFNFIICFLMLNIKEKCIFNMFSLVFILNIIIRTLTQCKELQQPAGWASAHGWSDCRPANGGANGVDVCADWEVGGGPNPLLNASACNDSIKRFAAWRSASRSSAVWRLSQCNRKRKITDKREKKRNWRRELNICNFVYPTPHFQL